MTVEGSKVWITIFEISERIDPKQVNSFFNTANVGCNRNSGHSWINRPHITPRSKFQIDYDSIPQGTIKKYNIPSKQFFIDQEKEVAKQQLETVELNTEAMRSGLLNAIAENAAPDIRAWYLQRLKEVEVKTPLLWKRLINDYTLLAKWLIKTNELLKLSGKWSVNPVNRAIAIQYGYNDVSAFLMFICKTINEQKLQNFNITNERKFIEKLKPFTAWHERAAEGGYQEELKTAALESLISKKLGVTNNSKRSEWHINQVVKLARHGLKLNPKTISDDLNTIAREANKDEVSPETVRLWLRDKAIQNRIALEREGRMSWINKEMFVITRDGASVPDALWWIDGTPEELWWYDKSERKLKREEVIKVTDDYSELIVGWAFGNESMDTVYRAVKNAVEYRGTIAYQLTSDKGPALTSIAIKAWFKTLFGGGYGHTPTTTGLARAKVIEPMQAHFRQQFLSRDINHSFGNITSQGEQANPEFVKAHLKDFPQSKEELRNMINSRIAMWNEAVGRKGVRKEAYELEYDDRRRVDDMLFQDLFYLFKDKTNTYSAEGLEFSWNKKTYKFIAPVPITANSSEEDCKQVAQFLNENAGRKFSVKFDPDDMNKIALYYNGAFYTWAYNKVNTKRALYDTTTDDSKLLHKYWLVQKYQEAEIKEFYAKNDEFADAEGLLKAPMSLSSKTDRNRADSKVKQMNVDGQNVEVEVSKYAGISKWS